MPPAPDTSPGSGGHAAGCPRAQKLPEHPKSPCPSSRCSAEDVGWATRVLFCIICFQTSSPRFNFICPLIKEDTICWPLLCSPLRRVFKSFLLLLKCLFLCFPNAVSWLETMIHLHQLLNRKRCEGGVMQVVTRTLRITFGPHTVVGLSVTAWYHHESSWTVPSRLLVHPFMLFFPRDPCWAGCKPQPWP